MDIERTYFQCECHCGSHGSLTFARYGKLIKSKAVLEDTATMMVTVDNDIATCQCAYCDYKKKIDLTKEALTIIQHGKETKLDLR